MGGVLLHSDLCTPMFVIYNIGLLVVLLINVFLAIAYHDTLCIRSYALSAEVVCFAVASHVHCYAVDASCSIALQNLDRICRLAGLALHVEFALTTTYAFWQWVALELEHCDVVFSPCLCVGSD